MVQDLIDHRCRERILNRAGGGEPRPYSLSEIIFLICSLLLSKSTSNEKFTLTCMFLLPGNAYCLQPG